MLSQQLISSAKQKTSMILILLSFYIVAYSVVIFGYQVFIWLKFGQWVSLPTTYLFTSPPSTDLPLNPYFLILNIIHIDWLINPNSWGGVQKIMTYILDIPYCLSTFFLAIGLFYIADKIDNTPIDWT